VYYLKKKLIIIILLITILFSEALVLGLVNSHGNNSYLLSSFGLIPNFEHITTTKNGLEVRDYNYSWITDYEPNRAITTVYHLEMDVHLYSYSNNAFNCVASTNIEDLGGQAVNYNGTRKEYTINQGDNLIEITRRNVPTATLDNSFEFSLSQPNKMIYIWELSDGKGESSYGQNSLNQDEYAIIQNGYNFQQNQLLSTLFYLWLPTIAVFVIGYSAYRIRKWVKEVNKLKTRINPPT
jgi:hypothetical protein